MKFKNIKKKARLVARPAKNKKSPSNSRSITEYFSSIMHDLIKSLPKLWDIGLKITVLVAFIFVAVVVGLDAYRNFHIKQGIDFEREELLKELSFWKSFVDEHKDYGDAYFKMSALEYQLGNSSKAKEYLEKGLLLDPNSQNGKRIEEFINK